MTATRPWRIALITSQFNDSVTAGLRRGALAHLKALGLGVLPEDMHSAPGAFEIPLLAQALARTGRVDGIICLGCVTKHETAHFEFVSLGATMGLMQAMLATGVPMAFGILTTYTDEQAEARSAEDANNKGIEAAAAVVSSLETLERFKR